MQITTFSDYCLRILIYLAVADGEKAPARQIAERYGISTHHVAKASQWLARQGYVAASRGKGGGLRLALKPEDIRIGEVIRQAEAGTGLVECMRKNGRCAIAGPCGLEGILHEGREAFFGALDRRTLADAVFRKRDIARRLHGASLGDRP